MSRFAMKSRADTTTTTCAAQDAPDTSWAGLAQAAQPISYHIISPNTCRSHDLRPSLLGWQEGCASCVEGFAWTGRGIYLPRTCLDLRFLFMLAASLFEHPTCAVIWLSCLQRCECLSQPRVCDAQGPKLDLGLHHFVISVIITILTFEPRSWADRTYPLSGSVFSLRTLEPFQTFQSPELSPSCQVGLSISLYGPISALSW